NAGTCIKDCPSGSADGYCDGISDGRCDTDCAAGGDPDCRTADTATTARSPSSPLAALAAAGGTALVLARRRD
ncbi:MAG TPA: hypothetical protein VLL74_00085, partial [Methanoregula sp.]|nr:hypothetical protein [Methanoregula sp.]